MNSGYETLSQIKQSDYENMKKKIDLLIEGYKSAASKYDIQLQVNRAGSMIGFFFTNEEVIEFDSAQTSDRDLFASYYGCMIEAGVRLRSAQFEGLFLST